MAAVLLAVLYVVVDFAVLTLARNKLQETASRRAPEAASVQTRLEGFPFLLTALTSGKVRDVGVTLRQVDAGRIGFDRVDVDVSGPVVDRAVLINDRQVQLDSIDRATVTAEVTASSLSQLVGLPVRLSPGKVTVDVAGRPVTATVDMVGRRLQLSGRGLSLVPVPIPRRTLLPCDPSVEIVADRIRLSCSFTEIPPVLVEAASRAANSG